MNPIVLRSVLALLCVLPLCALDRGANVPPLEGVTWIDGSAEEVITRPRVVLLFATDAPQSQRTAVDLGKLLRDRRGRLEGIALSGDERSAITAFRRDLGLEMDYAVGHAPAGLLTALAADARGLPHVLLVAADGSLLWQGHPELLPRVLDRHLD